MDGNKVNIIEMTFDKSDWSFIFSFNILGFVVIIILVILIYLLLKKLFSNNKGRRKQEIIPVKLKYKIGNAEIEYNIKRSYENIEIAHKIYIELVTRKAAIEIDKENDVIYEVYNSWYTLFQVTRDELKKLTGQFLYTQKDSEPLIRLLSDILNKSLRPHLTEYQAKFRKWYQEALDDTKYKNKSPQEIQKDFPDFDNLVKSMIEVNTLLIGYSKELKRIVTGDENGA